MPSLRFGSVVIIIVCAACSDRGAMPLDSGGADSGTHHDGSIADAMDAAPPDAVPDAIGDVRVEPIVIMQDAGRDSRSDATSIDARRDTSVLDGATDTVPVPSDAATPDVAEEDVLIPGCHEVPASADWRMACRPELDECDEQAAGYTCFGFSGIVVSYTCELPCDDDCDCPLGYGCRERRDKAGGHFLCQ